MVQGRPPTGLEGTSSSTGDLAGDARAFYGYDGAVGSLDDVRSGFARERAGSSSSSGRAGHATYTRKRSEDARRFAASAAAAQGALTAELFGTGGGARGGARGGRSAGRYESPALRGPTAEHITDGFLEVFPRGNDRKPALLGQLESLLAEKLRLTEKLTESTPRRRMRSDSRRTARRSRRSSTPSAPIDPSSRKSRNTTTERSTARFDQSGRTPHFALNWRRRSDDARGRWSRRERRQTRRRRTFAATPPNARSRRRRARRRRRRK